MKNLSLLILAACLAFSCAGGPEQAYDGPDRMDYVISDDFDTNELYGWECYPYAQDIGYDPNTACMSNPTHNGSKFALARIVKPNDVLDLSQGFTKQIDMWTTADTVLDCALYFMSDRVPEKVEVMLGLFDGRLFTHTLDAPTANNWMEISLPISAFTLDGAPLDPNERLQVVAVKGWYKQVSHLISYTVLIDDFSINGKRDRGFVAVEPTSTRFEKFGVSILDSHFAYGENISVSVRPEGERTLESLSCTVTAFGGRIIADDIQLYDDGSHGDASSGDGVWTNNVIYSIADGDPRGEWTLDFTGVTGSNDVRSKVRFIMPGKRIARGEHPRLFFTKEELAKRAASDNPALKRMYESFTKESSTDFAAIDLSDPQYDEAKNLIDESLTGGPYSVTNERGRWGRPIGRLKRIISSGSWRYAFTGDKVAGEKAVEAMLRLCAYDVWNHPWMEHRGRHIYYPVGYTTMPVAIGYDLCYELMSDDERALVREGMMNKAVRHFYRDMVEMNRMPSSLSNHIAVIVSGVGMAAAAMYGDDPDMPEMEPYLSGILSKTKDFIDKTYFAEGSYGEPYTYQAMASRDLTETLFAWERLFGVDYTSTTYLKDLYVYPLYATHSSGLYQDFGDVSHYYGMSQTHMQWLTYRMGNPWAYSYVKPVWESGRPNHMSWLWYRDDIEPRKRSELVTSKLFEGKGNMIMRSDWEDEGSISIFKCGPNSNHYHLDQGTFVVMTNGEELLSDAGHSSDYYKNLYYPAYYTQTVGHNCMLVDMNPESQDIADYENGVAALRNYPAISHHLASDIADEVEGDLTSVYKDKLASYTRSVLYMKPDIMFMLDRVKGNGGHEYNWLFHAEHTDGKNSIVHDKDTGRISIIRSKARLDMDVLSPEIVMAGIRDSDRDESFITLTSAKDVEETAFLAVLNPRAGVKANDLQSTLIEDGSFLGAVVKHGRATDIALFTRDGKAGAMQAESIDANAERCAVRFDSRGKIQKAILRGTSLSFGGKLLLSSDNPVIAAVSFGRDGIELDVNVPGDSAAGVTVSVPGRPSSVLFDGIAKEDWHSGDGTVMVRMPSGRSSVRIMR